MERHHPTQQWYDDPKYAAPSDGNKVCTSILIDDHYLSAGCIARTLVRSNSDTPDNSARRTEKTHPFQLSDQPYSNPIALFLPVKTIRGKLQTIPAFLNPLTHPQRRYILKQRLIPNILCYFGSGYARILFPLTESNLSCSVTKVH